MGFVFCWGLIMGDKVAKKSKKGKKESKKRNREQDVPTPQPQSKKQKTAHPASSTKVVAAYRKENRISVDTGDHGDDRDPILSFDECKEVFPSTSSLIDAFCKGFTTPTPIQAQCWPSALSG